MSRKEEKIEIGYKAATRFKKKDPLVLKWQITKI